MTQEVSSTVTIDIPRQQAWQKLRDISLPHNYVPGIVKTEIVSDQREGVGASRYVYRNEKSYIQETVTEWNDGEGFLIRLHRGDKPAPPFRNAWFRYHLADAGDNVTAFTASMGFELPWGGVGAWLEKRLAGFVEHTIADVALSMKLYYESGEPTTPAKLKAFKAGKR
ncbi:MAG: SRPBCC family protein [Thiohalobacterales bacterium]|nr:SRPBCC family protein [Thiohalobacterales bacterium]